MSDIFMKATREKLRFSTGANLVSVEALWDLPLESNVKVSLEQVAQIADEDLRKRSAKSFVSERTVVDDTCQLRMDVILEIIRIKKAERDEKTRQAARESKREQIMQLIQSKENQALESAGIDELRKMLENL